MGIARWMALEGVSLVQLSRRRYVRCRCGLSDCWMSGLLPLPAHVSALFQALIVLGASDRLRGGPINPRL